MFQSFIKKTFVLVLLFLNITISLANPQQPTEVIFQKQITKLETTSSGRIGIFAINTANNNILEYRADERFPLCSTSKLITVAAILKLSMKNQNLLQKKIFYDKHTLIAHSPITAQHVATGMTIAELAAAAITESDNTAANLLMQQLGGPHAITLFARSIGNNSFRLDRWEPELNTAIPGDLRDTATPSSMAQSIKQLVLGKVLAPQQRTQLKTWLIETKTGDARIRAAVPKNYIVADKTGSGAYGTTNDVAIIWPPHAKPIIMAIYFTQKKQTAVSQDAVVAAAARIALANF